MVIGNLPYPGYTWSLTQHLGKVASDPHILFALLVAANIYANHKDAADLITEYMIERGLLPPNIRQERPQIWRDYQQTLAEFGLIVSTSFTGDRIVITPIGSMWLDGSIGFSEFMGTQALRYQYPNGYKWQLSGRVREALKAEGASIPDTRTELDAQYGIQVKPAVLVLRVLLELLGNRDRTSHLSARECLAALMPVSRNQDWPQALHNLKKYRNGTSNFIDKASLRHIQEWFRFLNCTDFCRILNDGSIGLSEYSLQNTSELLSLCKYHEDPSTFWLPLGTNRNENGWSWYNFYGTPDIRSQWLMPVAYLEDEDFVNRNYPEGVEVIENLEGLQAALDWSSHIALKGLEEKGQAEFEFKLRGERIDIAKLREASFKRQQRTTLHDQIVRQVAERFSHHSYSVKDDPQSVDLLATKGQAEIIVEVKTVTRRSLRNRLRLGVGQLAEYRYRRQIETHNRPTGILVLSSTDVFPKWLIDYFETDLHLGLVSLVRADSFKAHTRGEAEGLLVS